MRSRQDPPRASSSAPTIRRGARARGAIWRAFPCSVFGRPEEVAAAIAFQLSEDAAFMTGQTLHVDGGASVGRAVF
ncbi:SDR family oxidoreductase [Aureimonas glaciei]|uniref:SDR family oxidoreductase n=1 Tax=Aureimonas glaciei TaxID=1776957 RepID=UPI0027E4E56F|nr:SDR family oxidoreductase [Aureimonas glaciei]